MKLVALGCAGGEGLDFNATAFLINDTVLVDAGSVVRVTTLEQQRNINYALITHAHLDHIKDLGFIVDNTFGQRKAPLKVYSIPPVIAGLKQHYFNWVIWPDFTELPTPENSVIELVEMRGTTELDGLNIEYFTVNHPGEAVGYIIEEKSTDCSILVTGDTGPTDEIWAAARKRNNLKAIFVDTAFPDNMVDIARVSGHLTPHQLHQQLHDNDLLKQPVYCYHLKPSYHDEVEADIRKIGLPHVRVLEQGETISL